MTLHWGLLGPEQLGGARRIRTLGLGAAVRRFNQLAVPGVGGVWFAKQLFLATLGVRVADRLRATTANVRALEVANAIEALACWCGLKEREWRNDARLRGSQKLSAGDDLTFARLRQARYYVTQPMRMATVEALPGLGFVETVSPRFNSFRATLAGRTLIEVSSAGFKPFNGSLENYLFTSVRDGEPFSKSSEALKKALSPVITLPTEARDFIRTKLCEGSGQNAAAARRKNALSWVRSLEEDHPAGWDTKPDVLDAYHWSDLRMGEKFFATRSAAIELLNGLEAQLARLAEPRRSVADLLENVPEGHIKALRQAAQRFLEEDNDPTEGRLASRFCGECNAEDPKAIIRHLVGRDDRVLRVVDDMVIPGSGFSRQASDDVAVDDGQGAGVQNTERVPVPDGISDRIRNLYLLELDLQGRLDTFLQPPPEVTA